MAVALDHPALGYKILTRFAVSSKWRLSVPPQPPIILTPKYQSGIDDIQIQYDLVIPVQSFNDGAFGDDNRLGLHSFQKIHSLLYPWTEFLNSRHSEF
jgi:hypothetical protein